ncbi:MAG: putative 4-hydroxybenzoate polyprenyltransferase [Pelosinus sp.]|nr:putative 4-hydroxybenzoate polyprenyltransferase [Pelosinus sp.]
MNKLKAHIDNVALSHSVFALPFAYMGAFLAVKGMPSWHDLIWITIAMVSARSAALALNNYIDLKYDVDQPRFARRPMVTGAIGSRDAIIFIVLSIIMLLIAASMLKPICVILAPLALVPLSAYPYMKRFSWTCHLVLGSALAAAPIGAWMAVRGDVSLSVILLGGAVGIWIAAFDVIYACQDVQFDKAHQLHSMPVRFGVAGALSLAKKMHILSIAAFLAVGVLESLPAIYYFGVIVAAIVLIYQHKIVSPHDLHAVTQKYFMRNGIVGISIFIFTIIGLFL